MKILKGVGRALSHNYLYTNVPITDFWTLQIIFWQQSFRSCHLRERLASSPHYYFLWLLSSVSHRPAFCLAESHSCWFSLLMLICLHKRLASHLKVTLSIAKFFFFFFFAFRLLNHANVQTSRFGCVHRVQVCARCLSSVHCLSTAMALFPCSKWGSGHETTEWK